MFRLVEGVTLWRPCSRLKVRQRRRACPAMRPLPHARPDALLDPAGEAPIRLYVLTANYHIFAVLATQDGFIEGDFQSPIDRAGHSRRQSRCVDLRRLGLALGWAFLLLC